MGLIVDWLAVDCATPATLAQFWAEVLGYRIEHTDDPNEVMIVSQDGRCSRIVFLRVPDTKSVKNRLHLDLRPDDQQIEVARVLALGARRVDIGQRGPTSEPSWVVLADPEGNEFCILRNLTADEWERRATERAQVVTDRYHHSFVSVERTAMLSDV
jgi:predicted enzyme related to lactoylglutathione lyase